MCSNSEVTEHGEWGWEGAVEVWEDFPAGHHDCLDSVSPSGKRTSMTRAVGRLKLPVTSADKVSLTLGENDQSAMPSHLL